MFRWWILSKLPKRYVTSPMIYNSEKFEWKLKKIHAHTRANTHAGHLTGTLSKCPVYFLGYRTTSGTFANHNISLYSLSLVLLYYRTTVMYHFYGYLPLQLNWKRENIRIITSKGNTERYTISSDVAISNFSDSV